MLSAKDGEYDLADAFDLGADDYLIKPFSFVVLFARLRALVRRGAPERPAVLTAGDLELDPARHRVTRDGIALTLTPREFSVLEFLMRNRGTVVSQEEIVQIGMGHQLHGRRKHRRGVHRISATQDRSTVRQQQHRNRSRCRIPARRRRSTGSVTTNRAPPLDAVADIDRAAVGATISATIDRPRPAPPASRVRGVSRRTKRSNTRCRSATGNPGPSSATEDLRMTVRRGPAFKANLVTRVTDARCRRDCARAAQEPAGRRQPGPARHRRRPPLTSVMARTRSALGIDDVVEIDVDLIWATCESRRHGQGAADRRQDGPSGAPRAAAPRRSAT